MIFDYLQNQIKEIQNSKALQLYGAALSLVHTFTFFFWMGTNYKSLKFLFTERIPICWSIFQNCQSFRPFWAQWIDAIFSVYFLTSIACVLLFIVFKKIRLAYILLILLNVLKYSVLLQDYNLMGNYHYMAFISSLFYLLIPNKLFFGKLIIIGFYLSSGILKISPEWLSGNTISSSFLDGKLLEWACAYVVVLQLIQTPLLLSRNKISYYLVLLQLVIFHTFSISIVGYFFPIVMFLLLSIFFLERNNLSSPVLVKKNILGLIALLAFTIAQLIPLYFFRKSSLTGEGRILSVNLFDAKTSCDNRINLKYTNAQFIHSLESQSKASRLHCDPQIFYWTLKDLCKKQSSEENFRDLDFVLYSKKSTDQDWSIIFQATDFCSRTPKMSWLGQFYEN